MRSAGNRQLSRADREDIDRSMRRPKTCDDCSHYLPGPTPGYCLGACASPEPAVEVRKLVWHKDRWTLHTEYKAPYPGTPACVHFCQQT